MNEELKILISAEVSKLKQGVENAKKSVKGFQDKVKEASKEVDSKFSAIGTAMVEVGKKAATGLAAAGTALLALGASTAEYRTEQAKLVTAFETAGSSAAQAKETYNDLYRVLGDSGVAVEAANHLAKLTTNQNHLAEWTSICQGVYATFGDSIPIEGLTEAANETAKTGALTGSLADALNWAGVSEEYFTGKLEDCVTQSEREKLIRETLTGLYNDAAHTYEKNNAEVIKQNEAQAKLQETTAKLGEAVAPVVTAFTSFATDALAVVIPYVQGLADEYLPELNAALYEAEKGLKAALEWVKEHKTLLAVMGGIITGIAVAIGLYNAVAAVKAAMDALQVTTLKGLIAAYAAQAVAMVTAIAPYLLIVAAIAAVIAIIVLCIKHWDKIKEVAAKTWDSIQKGTEKAVSKVVSKYSEMKNKAQQYFNAMGEDAGNIFAAITRVIESNIKTALTVIKNVLSLIKSVFKGDLEGVKQAAANILNALVDNFRTKLEAAKDIVRSALNIIKDFFSNFSWKLPKPKLPKFSISGGEAPWGFMGKGSLPKISISWNRLGGIFDKPTLFGFGSGLQGIGEDGAEAVVPLEKNLGWLDRLAEMLNDRMGGNTPIVLNVDGKVFAQTAINTINANTRQTGRLALNLV